MNSDPPSPRAPTRTRPVCRRVPNGVLEDVRDDLVHALGVGVRFEGGVGLDDEVERLRRVEARFAHGLVEQRAVHGSAGG